MCQLKMRFEEKRGDKMKLIEVTYIEKIRGTYGFKGLRPNSIYLYSKYINSSMFGLKNCDFTLEEIEDRVKTIRGYKNTCKSILMKMTFSEV